MALGVCPVHGKVGARGIFLLCRTWNAGEKLPSRGAERPRAWRDGLGGESRDKAFDRGREAGSRWVWGNLSAGSAPGAVVTGNLLLHHPCEQLR